MEELINRLDLFKTNLVCKKSQIGLKIFIIENDKYQITIKIEYKYIRFEILDLITMKYKYEYHKLTKEWDDLILYLKVIS